MDRNIWIQAKRNDYPSIKYPIIMVTTSSNISIPGAANLIFDIRDLPRPYFNHSCSILRHIFPPVFNTERQTPLSNLDPRDTNRHRKEDI